MVPFGYPSDKQDEIVLFTWLDTKYQKFLDFRVWNTHQNIVYIFIYLKKSSKTIVSHNNDINQILTIV